MTSVSPLLFLCHYNCTAKACPNFPISLSDVGILYTATETTQILLVNLVLCLPSTKMLPALMSEANVYVHRIIYEPCG